MQEHGTPFNFLQKFNGDKVLERGSALDDLAEKAAGLTATVYANVSIKRQSEPEESEWHCLGRLRMYNLLWRITARFC